MGNVVETFEAEKRPSEDKEVFIRMVSIRVIANKVFFSKVKTLWE
jgi:hypothetical protein